MQSTFVTTALLPLALAIIMLGLGLSLTPADFKRILQFPRAVLVGLLCQMLLLPAVAYAIAKGFELPGELAVGLMLLSASPGGPTANLFSHLARGDVALNITLTATNSILSLFTMPFIVNLSLVAFMGEGKVLPLQFAKVVQVVLIVLLPVAIGMLVRAKKPAVALGLDKPVRILSSVFLVLVIAATAHRLTPKVHFAAADAGMQVACHLFAHLCCASLISEESSMWTAAGRHNCRFVGTARPL